MEERIRRLIEIYDECATNLLTRAKEGDYEDKDEEGQLYALNLCYKRVISDLRHALGKKEWTYGNDTKVGLRVD